MSVSNFNVIVVGGGPVGLTAAHALTQAGIPFTVLETRPSVVIDAGSNLVLLPYASPGVFSCPLGDDCGEQADELSPLRFATLPPVQPKPSVYLGHHLDTYLPTYLPDVLTPDVEKHGHAFAGSARSHEGPERRQLAAGESSALRPQRASYGR